MRTRAYDERVGGDGLWVLVKHIWPGARARQRPTSMIGASRSDHRRHFARGTVTTRHGSRSSLAVTTPSWNNQSDWTRWPTCEKWRRTVRWSCLLWRNSSRPARSRYSPRCSVTEATSRNEWLKPTSSHQRVAAALRHRNECHDHEATTSLRWAQANWYRGSWWRGRFARFAGRLALGVVEGIAERYSRACRRGPTQLSSLQIVKVSTCGVTESRCIPLFPGGLASIHPMSSG